MPVDHRRINGPEESVPYELFGRHEKTSVEHNIKARSGNRTFEEHRKIFLKTGVVSQAKGSAYVEIGQTKLIVSVFDPREIPNKPDYSLKGEIYCEFKFAPFSCPKRRLHQQNNEEKQYSFIMKKALESTVCLHELPNFQVDIYTLVLHNDGSTLSAAIIGAGLALAEAGVPMYDIVTSVTLGIQQDTMFVDPTLPEQIFCEVHLSPKEYKNVNHGVITISKLHTQQQICQFYHSGFISLDTIKTSLETLSKLCDSVVLLVQKCLFKSVIKNNKIQ